MKPLTHASKKQVMRRFSPIISMALNLNLFNTYKKVSANWGRFRKQFKISIKFIKFSDFCLSPAPLLATLSILNTDPILGESELSGSDSNSAVVPLERMTIIGDRKDQTEARGSAYIVDEDELQQYNHSDINRILKQVPGIYIQEEDGFGLRPNIGIRGAHPHRSRKIVIMEDGLLSSPAPYAAPAAYYFPGVGKLNTIEVFKGPAAIPYGPNNVGGAINLVTKPTPLSEITRLMAAYGSFNYQRFQISHGNRFDDFSYLVYANQQQSDGFKNLPDGSNTGFKRRDLMVKLDQDIVTGSLNHAIRTKFSFSDEVSNETYLGLTSDDFDRDPYQRYAASQNDKMEWMHHQIDIRDFIEIGSDIDLAISLYSRRFTRNWTRFDRFSNSLVSTRDILNNPTGANLEFINVLKGISDSESPTGLDRLIITNNDRNYLVQGVDLQGNWLLLVREELSCELKFGARWHEDEIRRNHTEDTLAMFAGQLQDAGVERVPTATNLDMAEAKSIWTQIELSTEEWTIEPGVRYETVELNRDDFSDANADSQRSDTIIVPGIGVGYRLWPHWILVAGVYEGFTLPGPGQDEAIEPEKARNYEFGVRFTPLPFHIEWIAFFSDYENILGTCSFSAGCNALDLDLAFNGGKAEISGLELLMSHRFQLDQIVLPLKLNYTFTQAKFSSNIESTNPEWGIGDIRPGDPLPYIPESQLSLNIGLQWDRWLFDLGLKYQSQVYDQTVSENRATIDGYSVIDTSLNYVADVYDIFVKADNLLAESYEVSLRPFGARPGKPRSFEIGMVGKF